jgi:ribosomal protein L11 methyltransferase
MKQHFSEVRISVAREQAALAEVVLEQMGALAITLQDNADDPVLEPGPGETPLWPAVQLCGLFEADCQRQRITDALQRVPGVERPEHIRWRNVADQVWERAWMDRFHPMKYGRRLWIVPTGMQIPYGEQNIEISLDPGLAFGSGTHPTTALCLEWIDGRDLAGQRVVDYGCGSGILGIATALKGANRVICVDNDPQALEAAQANGKRNGVQGIMEYCAPEEFKERENDVVLANILAGPLIELRPVLTGCLKPAGFLVLSGVLEEQADLVLQAYRQDCIELKAEAREGWSCLVSAKRRA